MSSSLILGGHSFIAPLGNDPAPAEREIDAIVDACLDAGITRFDTTYLPERVALGASLARLHARDRARIIAWNFFTDFGPDGPVGSHEPYQPHHIAQLLRELRTDLIDRLVVHPVDDPAAQARQEALAVSWQTQGLVRELGTWMPPSGAERGPYAFAVAPCNVTVTDAETRFAAYHRSGWETLATSPFVRGWELDRRAAGQDRAVVADRLLRYAAFFPHVDALIVSMRRVEWVAANVAALARGPLGPDEPTL
jgi:aryl-alcohol dehydrogenase-like predicted oxidoreductase